MCDDPLLLGTSRHQHRLPIRRRHIERELDPEPPHRIDDRVDLRVVLPCLQFDDPRLRDPEPLGQGPLAQPVLRAIPQEGRRELARGGEPLLLSLETGISELLILEVDDSLDIELDNPRLLRPRHLGRP